MQIKRRSAPTLEGVARRIRSFEMQYEMSTEDFLERDCLGSVVTEDDASKWRYLREQLLALQEAPVLSLYSTAPRGRQAMLENFDCSLEPLAA
jgi:hypothetical protein